MAVRGLLAAWAALALACTVAGAQAASARGPATGKPAPQFVRTALDGQRIDLAALRGKVVLLNFWATWCAPCQVEMPVFAEWQRQYGAQGLQVVGVSMDDEAEPVRRLVAHLRLNYPVAMGDEKLGAQYGGVLGLPLTYLIGRDGRIQARFQGETDPAKIQSKLKALLASR
jgi:peroxiredoxin